MGATLTSTLKTKLELELEIDIGWIELCTEFNDLFVYQGLGSWTKRQKVETGWLIFDLESDEKPDWTAGLRAYIVGAPLPSGFYVIDKSVAIKAWEEGVKLKGLKWYECGRTDVIVYAELIQRVLFGEVKYS